MKKYAKVPRRYKLSKKNPAVFRIAGEFRERWWKRPICWIKGHKKRVICPYGIKAKQCERCGKYYWRKPTGEKTPIYKGGEVGELYGVRFIESK